MTSAWSGAGPSALIPAVRPEMADQCWRMAALSGEEMKVQAPGSRRGESRVLEVHDVLQGHGATALGCPLSLRGRGAVGPQAASRLGGAGCLLTCIYLPSVIC